MKFQILVVTTFSVVVGSAQTATTGLPAVTVYSTSVANQDPVGAFAMPVSALRYEPRVDLQARNLAEGQADVTIRGGIFENTGFNLGSVSLSDPQTGHYYSEIPVAPEMLSAASILTGADHALKTSGSTVGAIAYGWRPIANAGSAAINAGSDELFSTEFYEGQVSASPMGNGAHLAGDVAWAHSTGNGAIDFGDHRFERANARVELKSPQAQTDVFAGYQSKFFGWPNLYTPFNSAESENLQTVLLAINHRVDLGQGDFLEAGTYHRRNKDDYAFNRFAPLSAVHPFQHTTWVSGAAAGGRSSFSGDLAAEFHGEVSADELKSTSLIFGPYHTRSIVKLALAFDKTWSTEDAGAVVAKAGATYDDSNRDSGMVSPVLELAREWRGPMPCRVYSSYAASSQLPSYTALNSSPSSGLFRGNPRLGREKSRNAELGFSATMDQWTTQAAVFFREDRSLVDWTFQRGVTARTANAVDVDTTGFEIVTRRSWAKLDLVLGYTVLTKDADYRSAAIDASFYALNYAKHRFTAAIVYRFAPEWEVRVDNAARVQADNLLRAIGGDETLLSSAGLFYRPRAWRGFTFSVRADNLWNSNFQEVPSVPAAPREIIAGVSYYW